MMFFSWDFFVFYARVVRSVCGAQKFGIRRVSRKNRCVVDAYAMRAVGKMRIIVCCPQNVELEFAPESGTDKIPHRLFRTLEIAARTLTRSGCSQHSLEVFARL